MSYENWVNTSDHTRLNYWGSGPLQVWIAIYVLRADSREIPTPAEASFNHHMNQGASLRGMAIHVTALVAHSLS